MTLAPAPKTLMNGDAPLHGPSKDAMQKLCTQPLLASPAVAPPCTTPTTMVSLANRGPFATVSWGTIARASDRKQHPNLRSQANYVKEVGKLIGDPLHLRVLVRPMTSLGAPPANESSLG